MRDDQLKALGIDTKWTAPLNVVFQKYGINTPKRQAAFIGQCSVESDNFTCVQENLHYSAQRLTEVWPSRFPTIEDATPYAENPQKLADKVYGGRDGNTEDGDGFKYRGRGIIQVTFKDNYERCGKALNLDLINHPDLLLEPEFATLSAGWYWNKMGLNILADSWDNKEITKRINGGYNGLAERIAKTNQAFKVLG
jgi:putative chitinase